MNLEGREEGLRILFEGRCSVNFDDNYERDGAWRRFVGVDYGGIILRI